MDEDRSPQVGGDGEQFVVDGVVQRAVAAAAVGHDLTVSSILGLTIARHFLKLDALTEISQQQIETTLRPWLTAGLVGDDIGSPASPARSEHEEPRTA